MSSVQDVENQETSETGHGLWIGPVLATVIWILPTPTGLTDEAHALAALTALMATWWMTEAIPVAVTALIPLALFPFFGVGTAKEVAPSYGHDLIWLFFGGFQLAFAIERWGLHRRMAMFMVRLFGTRGDRLILGFMLAAGLLSMWLLNTSTTLMMLPVAMAVAAALEPEGKGPFGHALMLGLAYAASVGGMGTYLGTAPNGVFRGVAEGMNIDVSFGQWMLFAAPLSVLLIGCIWLYLTRIAYPVGRAKLPEDHPAHKTLTADLGAWSRGEKLIGVIFTLAVLAWVSRRWVLAQLGLPPKSVSDATIAIIITLVLYLLRVGTDSGERRTLLSWNETGKTPWHILILFGGGFALAGGFQRTGLSTWMGGQLADLTGGWPLPLLILTVVLFMTFLTEVTSNTATATVLLPIIGGLAVAAEIPPLLLMLPATMAASCAFMLPVATPPNAIVYGSGLIGLPEMARVGLWINIGTAFIITGWMLTWGKWVF
jgi:solute carrier family 13 (sodium-dependent dicarboxylate transporter), member 2/3/5